MVDTVKNIQRLKDYENLEEILGLDLGGAIYKLVDINEEINKKFDRADLLINELYESGCLDLQREELVKEWLGSDL